MGNLSETYGYYDSGESLFVSDPNQSFLFHISPDDTQTSSIWVAQRIPNNHCSIIANAFNIHIIDFNDTFNFFYGKNIKTVALRNNLWNDIDPFDFTTYSGNESYLYSSGRRMYYAYKLFGINNLSSTYTSLKNDQPYPTSIAVKNNSISLNITKSIMRSYFQNTIYDMSLDIESSGPFSTPDRYTGDKNEQIIKGHWERNISTSRTILSYIIELHDNNFKLSTIWIAPHAAHTSFYNPFYFGINQFAIGYQNNDINKIDRYKSASQAARWVFNISQLRFIDMIQDIKKQMEYEENSIKILQQLEIDYLNNKINFIILQIY